MDMSKVCQKNWSWDLLENIWPRHNKYNNPKVNINQSIIIIIIIIIVDVVLDVNHNNNCNNGINIILFIV